MAGYLYELNADGTNLDWLVHSVLEQTNEWFTMEFEARDARSNRLKSIGQVSIHPQLSIADLTQHLGEYTGCSYPEMMYLQCGDVQNGFVTMGDITPKQIGERQRAVVSQYDPTWGVWITDPGTAPIIDGTKTLGDYLFYEYYTDLYPRRCIRICGIKIYDWQFKEKRQ